MNTHENVESMAAEHAGTMHATGRAPSDQRRCARQKLVALCATERLWSANLRRGELFDVDATRCATGPCTRSVGRSVCRDLVRLRAQLSGRDQLATVLATARMSALNYFGSLLSHPGVKHACRSHALLPVFGSPHASFSSKTFQCQHSFGAKE